MRSFIILLFCPLISALAFAGPKATPLGEGIESHAQGWSPQPTKAPSFKDLLKRQSSQFTFIEGPDDNCGYQFGSSDLDYYLGLCDTSTCGFATASGSNGGIVCYDATSSHLRYDWTSCIGGAGATSCLEDSACSDNPGIMICTDSIESHCNVGTWVGMQVEALWCDSTSYSGAMVPVYTTYDGQRGRVYSVVEGPTTTSKSTPVTSTTITTPSLPSSSTSTSSSQTTTPTPTPTPAPKKSTPIGPIVGGVIGGLALLAAIAAGIFFCLRKQRQDKQREPIREIADSPPSQPQYASDKYPAQVSTAYAPPKVTPPQNPPQQVQYQQTPPTQPQYPAEKYPTVAGGAFPANGNVATTAAPEQRYNSPPPQQQAPQAQPAVAVQPSYNQYQQPHPQQQAPQPMQPAQQNTYYSAPPGAPNFQVQSAPTPLTPEVRPGSVVSAISSPGSPAPPYVNPVPAVQELSGEHSNDIYPSGRMEMSGESNHTYPVSGANHEMAGESAPYPIKDSAAYPLNY
ncbi:uncharacterized protein PAC_16449 [Phialocephala subalpina]|uniref:Uncharacterized protein n=1 Tax=Phialocephala subalpina TaxID=576137 RepID=A0A1L7XNE8_9HELO|nr:uncharacterized protein PAC_16449 [Phialocephala subalpina]